MTNTPVGQLLRAALTADAWSTPSPAVARLAEAVDPAAAAEIADFHGVSGYVGLAVAAAKAAPELIKALEPAHLRGLLTHMRTVADLSVVTGALRPAGIAYAVLKGPVLATRTHARPDLRAYSDLDLLVPPPHFGRAVSQLMDAGCQPVVAAWRALRDAGAGEISLTMPSGGSLDLHWHTLNSPDLRSRFTVDPIALVARCVTADVGGVAAPVLAPADELVYVATHMVLSGADRMIWTKDVDLLARGAHSSVDEVVKRAGEARSSLVVAVALALAASTLGTPIPPDLRRRLDGGGLWSLIASVTARASRPGSRQGHAPSLARVVARSTRAATQESVRELAHRARSSRVPAGLRPGQRPPDVDQAQARSEFLDWVDGHAKLPTV